MGAKTHQEMVEWMKMLSTHTMLHAENEYIKQAEEMIAKASGDRYIQVQTNKQKETHKQT